MLQARDVGVEQNGRTIISSVSLTVKRNEIVSIVGPNGSGKSALLGAIAGIRSLANGSVKINHFNLISEAHQAKAHLGYLPNPVTLEPFLNGYEILEVIGAHYQLAPSQRQQRITELLSQFRAETDVYSLVNQLDGSLRQIIGLIASLLHEPSVLLWDEPLTHLDPERQLIALRLLEEHREKGGSVLIATNDLRLAATLSDRLVIINHGAIQAEGTVNELTRHYGGKKADLLAAYQALTHG